jgi:hypothetical protein
MPCTTLCRAKSDLKLISGARGAAGARFLGIEGLLVAPAKVGLILYPSIVAEELS